MLYSNAPNHNKYGSAIYLIGREQSLSKSLLKEISIDEPSVVHIVREEERYTPLSLQQDPEVHLFFLPHTQNSDKSTRKGFCIRLFVSSEEQQAYHLFLSIYLVQNVYGKFLSKHKRGRQPKGSISPMLLFLVRNHFGKR